MSLVLAACSPRPDASAKAPAPPLSPPTLQELLPLADRSVSSFEMSSDLGDEGLVILEIFRPRPDMAELTIAGRTQRLAIAPSRVSHLTGGIVLEEPLQNGHTFTGSFGTTTIVDTNVRVELPAGTFERCLTTVEESTRPPKRATSTYCPQIGLSHLVVETFGEEAIRLETKLRHHGPRVDLSAEDPVLPP